MAIAHTTKANGKSRAFTLLMVVALLFITAKAPAQDQATGGEGRGERIAALCVH
jgi:hypothetical protein